MTARRNSNSVEAARRYERPCRRPCKGHAKGTSQGRKCMAEGHMALAGPRMYGEGRHASSLKSPVITTSEMPTLTYSVGTPPRVYCTVVQ